MDDLTLVLSELEKLPLSAMPGVSNETGIPKDTIIKIKYGETANPRWKTIRPLANYFRSKQIT